MSHEIAPPTAIRPESSGWKKSAPILVLLITALSAIFIFDLGDYLTIDALREHRQSLVTFVDENPVSAALVYLFAYVVAVALSLPGGTVMTLVGGFLFGALGGTLLTVFGATIGATALFLAASTALGDKLREKAGGWIEKLQDGFQENELSYMFVLRLVPLFPFFVVNLAPAFLGVSLRSYVIATFFGIIPGTAVFSISGAGLGSVLDSSETFSLSGILTPELIAGLIGLALLSLIPVAYRKLVARSQSKAS